MEEGRKLRPLQSGNRKPWLAWGDQAPQFFHVSRSRGMQHRPSSQKKETLEDGVIQSVKHCGDQSYRRELWMPRDAENQGGAKADQDDPNILNAVIGQQAFQIMLHQRVQDTKNGGGDPYNEHE